MQYRGEGGREVTCQIDIFCYFSPFLELIVQYSNTEERVVEVSACQIDGHKINPWKHLFQTFLVGKINL